MLQYKTIEPGTLQLLKELQASPIFEGTRLVGGTALALQLGHRSSIDLDFFGSVQASSEDIRDFLSEEHSITIVKESRNINIYLIDGIKVDIVNYRYQWIDTPVVGDGIVLAGLKDIAAMKIAAVVGRCESVHSPDNSQLLSSSSTLCANLSSFAKSSKKFEDLAVWSTTEDF